MTKTEIVKLITALKAMYPQSYSKLTNEELAAAVDAWHTVLDDYSYSAVSAGLKAFARSSTSAFAPSPGQLVEAIRQLEHHPETETTAAEAWSLVEKAARDATYHAEERFAELPPIVQKCVGSPANLREIAKMEADVVGSVQKSLFVKAYNAAQQRAVTEQKIPENLKQIATAEQQKREALAEKTMHLLKVVK